LTLGLQHEEKWVNRYTQKYKNVYRMAMTINYVWIAPTTDKTLWHTRLLLCSFDTAKCRYSYGSNTKKHNIAPIHTIQTICTIIRNILSLVTKLPTIDSIRWFWRDSWS